MGAFILLSVDIVDSIFFSVINNSLVLNSSL